MMYIEEARKLVEEANQLEKKIPQKAAIKYLDASELFIKASKSMDREREEEYLKIANKCFEKSQKVLQQRMSKEEPGLQVDKPTTTFKDIGGLEELKEEIRLKIIEPFKHPEVFKRFGKKIGGGILMYGPPGCGKSLIAQAAAGEADCAFFNVKASDLKSKYVGETEKNIADLFEKVRKSAPAIVFFDEFDALGGDRSNISPYDKNAVNQLLLEMDGFGNKDAQILLLAATNEPWNIDPALCREGRFGTSIYVPPPDFPARKEIFAIHLKGRPVALDVSSKLLASMTEHYSGADCMAICEAATDIPIREYLRSKTMRKISFDDFAEILKKRKSSLLTWYKKAIQQLKRSDNQQFFEDLMEDGYRILSGMSAVA